MDLSDWLNALAVPYDPVDGWETRTSAGQFHPAGLMIHDTGSEQTSLSIVVDGRADLPGPLYHLYLATDGTLWLVTADGNANHAGKGDLNVLARVQQDAAVQARPGSDSGGGNEWFYALSLEGNSVDDFEISYPIAVDAAAAICAGKGWDPMTRIIAHKEWTKRKPDPAFDMHQFRLDVKGRLAMAQITTEDLEFLQALKAATEGVDSNATFPTFLIPWFRKWRGTDNPDVLEESDEVDALETRIEAIETALAQLGDGHADLTTIATRVEALEKFESEVRDL